MLRPRCHSNASSASVPPAEQLRRSRSLRLAMSSLRARDEGFTPVFGMNLARCRGELGVSQEELGFLADLHRTAISQLERGERVARSDTLVRLCGSLGVEPQVLLASLRWRPTLVSPGELEIEPASANHIEELNEERQNPKKSKPAIQKASNEPTSDQGKRGRSEPTTPESEINENP